MVCEIIINQEIFCYNNEMHCMSETFSGKSLSLALPLNTSRPFYTRIVFFKHLLGISM